MMLCHSYYCIKFIIYQVHMSLIRLDICRVFAYHCVGFLQVDP